MKRPMERMKDNLRDSSKKFLIGLPKDKTLDVLIKNWLEEGLVLSFKSVKSVPNILRFICDILISKRDIFMIWKGNSLIELELGIVKGTLMEQPKERMEENLRDSLKKL